MFSNKPSTPPRRNIGHTGALGTVITEISRREKVQSTVISKENFFLNSLTNVKDGLVFFLQNEREEIKEEEEKIAQKEEAKKEETFVDTAMRNISYRIFPHPKEEEKLLLPEEGKNRFKQYGTFN